MPECPGCNNELPEVHVVLDAAHHLMRIWCPFCRVWWSVKCRTQDLVFGENLKSAIIEEIEETPAISAGV